MHKRVLSLGAGRLRGVVIAAVLAAGFLLAPALQSQAALRAGGNYRMNTDPRPVRGKDAIAFAVNPRNSRQVVAVNTDWLNGQCQFAFSRNGGRTWRGGNLRPPVGFPDAPCTPGNHLAIHMYQSVVWGGRNRVYTTFIANRLNAQGQPEGHSLLIARSRNGGRTFSRAVVALPGGASISQGPDYSLPTIGVDPGRRNDRVYVTAGDVEASHTGSGTEENIVFSVSGNSGTSWSGPIRANAAGEHAVEQSQPVVGRDHAVYVSWRTRRPGSTPGTFAPQGFVTLAKSTDRGQTWTTRHVANVTGYTVTAAPGTPPFGQTRSFAGSTFPRMAIDRRRNRLYLVYGDGGVPTLATAKTRVRAADHFINPDEDVWFQRSLDGAASWSAPKRLNANSPEEITQTRHPNVSVAPNGRVDVVWNDRRHWYHGCVHTHNPCQEERLGDTYYAFSSNRGNTFSRNRRITDRSEGLDVGYDYRFGTGWAYGPEAVPLGNNTLLVGWMDSRRGNFENDTQDIYLSRVRLNARSGVPVGRVRSTSNVNLSVALSRLAYPGGPEAVLAGTFVTRPWARPVIVNSRDRAAVVAGSVLARANIAPVLLSGRSGLPARVKAEVRRLEPVGAYVLGDESKLSAQVVNDLVAAGVPSDQVTRLSGGSDAGTAALVARAMDRRSSQERSSGQEAFHAAVIANPRSPDAAAASAWAAHRRLPVLYVDRDSTPAATSDALRDLNIPKTYVIGTTRWVSDAVLRSLPHPTRVAGRRSDPATTSRFVVRQSLAWQVPSNVLFLTNVRKPMSAALVGSAAGRTGAQLALASRPTRGTQRIPRAFGLRNLDRIWLIP